MTASGLAEQLGLREFLALYAAVDKSQGRNTRFKVAKLTRHPESGTSHCLVVYAEAVVERVGSHAFDRQQRRTAALPIRKWNASE